MPEDLVREIGSRLELFVDDWLIERLDGLSLRLQHPVSREVVLTCDEPWEGKYAAFFSVFADGELYRMYYRGWESTPETANLVGAWWEQNPRVVCYAESQNGIDWVKPDLRRFEFRGSRKNNIVWDGTVEEDLFPPGPVGTSDFMAFKDLNPEAPDEQRYKAVTSSRGTGGIIGLVSPDGIHWQLLQNKPFLPNDTKGYDGPQSPGSWDPHRKCYHAFLRAWATGDGEEMPDSLSNASKSDLLDRSWRTIRHCSSKDFTHWTEPELIEYDTPLSLDEQLYTNAIQPYFRAPHLLIGMPKRFAPHRHKVTEHPTGGVSDAGFMTSRDERRWKLWPEAFIRPGLDRRNWVHRTNMPATGILQTSPEALSIYWSEHYDQPSNRLRRGTLRLDGFVSVEADPRGGELVTRPFTFEGRELLINYSTSAFGGIQAELQDHTGSAIRSLNDCSVIYGDEIEHAVHWNAGSDVSAWSGKPVRLRFVMKDADLFSIRFC